MPDPIWNQRIFYELLCYYARGARWLDLGCGRGPRSPELLRVRPRAQEKTYIGVDRDLSSLRDCKEERRVCADVESLPFPDGSFDLVTSNMVFEHLDHPVAVLREAQRVLQKEGVLIVHTASSLHYLLLVGRVLSRLLPRKTYLALVSCYTGRAEEDIFPTRYRANTVRKFSKVASTAGFRGGFLTHLETPFSCRGWMRTMEQHVRGVLPAALKGTILAVYFKRQWSLQEVK